MEMGLGVHVGDCCHQVLDSDGKVEELGVAVFTNWRECSHFGHQALDDYIWSPVPHLERAYDVWYIREVLQYVITCQNKYVILSPGATSSSGFATRCCATA